MPNSSDFAILNGQTLDCHESQLEMSMETRLSGPSIRISVRCTDTAFFSEIRTSSGRMNTETPFFCPELFIIQKLVLFQQKKMVETERIFY